MKNLFYCLLASLFIMSCGEDDELPTITITSANPATVLVTAAESGLAVLEGRATDDLGITNVAISSPSLQENILFSAEELDADGGFGIELNIPAGTPASSFDIEITATDTGGQTASATATYNITN